uniref:GCR056 n=1 Tax=Schmidtea mediterranea TaxID=79327 RepID=A0A193KUN5_SCHMD|nr:GCR056 [Schmidtea mediterranea]
MSTMTKELTNQIPTTIGILIIISVIGSIGNLLVLIIYSQKRDKSTANQFIKTLAISDCIVCLVIIPFTIYIEFNDWKVSIDMICKSYYFLNNSSIPFGALLITLIAIDRFFCVCYPFLSLMTVKRSKVCVFIVFMMSVVLGVLSVFQVKTFKLSKNSTNMNSTLIQSECIDVSRYANPTKYELLFFTIVQRSQLISYAICICVVICLYILIYRFVLAAARKKARLKGLNSSSTTSFLWNKFFKSRSIKRINSDSNNDDTSVPCQTTEELMTKPGPSNNDKAIKRKFKETILIQNFKTALMLFVVAITYIVTFLPACLMVNSSLALNLPVFYMYYINNAANPIIYCFMNKNFREDVVNFFHQHLIKK